MGRGRHVTHIAQTFGTRPRAHIRSPHVFLGGIQRTISRKSRMIGRFGPSRGHHWAARPVYMRHDRLQCHKRPPHVLLSTQQHTCSHIYTAHSPKLPSYHPKCPTLPPPKSYRIAHALPHRRHSPLGRQVVRKALATSDLKLRSGCGQRVDHCRCRVRTGRVSILL